MCASGVNQRLSTSRRDFLTRSGECSGGSVVGGSLVVAGSMRANRTPSKLPWSDAADAAPERQPTRCVPRAPRGWWPWPTSSTSGYRPATRTCSNSSRSRSTCRPSGSSCGLDAYKKAIDAVSPGGVVLLTTPPAFRPLQLGVCGGKGVPRLHGEVVRG